MKLNKKQKRTATIASMAALLAVVLGMGGQTFAKYITTNTADATSAVVAKWGVVIRNSIEDTIDTGAKKNVFEKSYTDANSKVVISSSNNVVAPGASGALTIEVTGTPEVAAKVSFKLSDFKDISLSSGSTTYYPIVLSWGTEVIARTEGKTMEALITEKLNASNAEFEAGKMVETQFTLSWEWPFSSTDNVNDKMDTLCGDAAANGNTIKDKDDNDWTLQNTVGFKISTEVVQLDKMTA